MFPLSLSHSLPLFICLIWKLYRNFERIISATKFICAQYLIWKVHQLTCEKARAISNSLCPGLPPSLPKTPFALYIYYPFMSIYHAYVSTLCLTLPLYLYVVNYSSIYHGFANCFHRDFKLGPIQPPPPIPLRRNKFTNKH